MKSRLVISLALLLWCFHCAAFGQNKTAGQLDGRWYLTFDLPDSIYKSAVAFKVETGGAVKTANLGEPLLFLDGGTIDGNQLKLSGKSAYGNVTITADLAGDKISGKWSLGFVGGAMSGEREPADKPKTNYSSVFERTWKTFDEKFYDPNFNGVAWRGIGDKYRPLIAKIADDAEFINTMRQMLKELKVSHVGFYYSPFENAITAKKSVAAENAASFQPLTWKKISPEIGYLQIKEFTESAEAVASVDRAFAEIGDAPNLVIDLRGNTGGTLSVAMRLGDFLFDKPTPVGFFATREGLKRNKVDSMDKLNAAKLPVYSGYKLDDFWASMDKNGAVAITSGGRAPKIYRGKVVILINERCASTTEAFVAVVKEMNLATLVGTKTRGAVLSAVSEKTVGDWLVRYPKADYRTARGKRIEGAGVEPHVAAEKNKELEIALQTLKKPN